MTGHNNKRVYNDDEAAQNYSSTRSEVREAALYCKYIFDIFY